MPTKDATYEWDHRPERIRRKDGQEELLHVHMLTLPHTSLSITKPTVGIKQGLWVLRCLDFYIDGHALQRIDVGAAKAEALSYVACKMQTLPSASLKEAYKEDLDIILTKLHIDMTKLAQECNMAAKQDQKFSWIDFTTYRGSSVPLIFHLKLPRMVIVMSRESRDEPWLLTCEALHVHMQPLTPVEPRLAQRMALQIILAEVRSAIRSHVKTEEILDDYLSQGLLD
jgi:hypothetical protein